MTAPADPLLDGVEAVVLDLDGTLLDHHGSVGAALQTWLPTLGLRADDQALARWLAAEERHFARWVSGELTYAGQARARLREALPTVTGDHDAAGSDDVLDELWTGYLQAYRASWRGYAELAEVVQLVTDLRAGGMASAVLTNGRAVQQRAKLDAIGVGEALGPLFAADMLPAAKPDPRAYLTVCQALGTRPERTLHVGDRHDLDVVGARAAGLRAVHLDRLGDGPAGEDHRSAALVPLLERLARSRGDATLQAYEQGAATYAARVREPDPALTALFDRVVALAGPGGRVLEIGSGPGRDARLLEQRGLRVRRTDATAAFVAMMREQGFAADLLDVRDGDLGRLLDPTASDVAGPFDLVFANAVLLHLDRAECERALVRLSAVVRPGGALVFTVKQGDGEAWSSAKLPLPRRFTYWQPDPLRAALARTPWRLLSLEQVPGPADDWLFVSCRLPAPV